MKRVKQIPTSTQTVEEPKNPDECNVYNLCKLFLTPDEDEALRARYQKGGLSFKEAKDYLFEKIMETAQSFFPSVYLFTNGLKIEVLKMYNPRDSDAIVYNFHFQKVFNSFNQSFQQWSGRFLKSGI